MKRLCKKCGAVMVKVRDFIKQSGHSYYLECPKCEENMKKKLFTEKDQYTDDGKAVDKEFRGLTKALIESYCGRFSSVEVKALLFDVINEEVILYRVMHI